MTRVTEQRHTTLNASIAAWIFSLTIAGCAVGPNFKVPPTPNVDRYDRTPEPASTVAANGIAQRFERATSVPGNWWDLFHSSQLNAEVERALSGNLDVKAAQANLRTSQDSLRAGYGVFAPQLDAHASAQRTRYSPQGIGQNFSGTVFNLYTLSASVSYVLDVFGGNRRALEALRAEHDFQDHTVAATYLTITGNVVNTVIARAAYRDQQNVTQEIRDALREEVAITEARVKAGTASYASELALQSQLATIEATIPALQLKMDQADHLLALLCGEAPPDATEVIVALADLRLPDTLPVELPSALVHKRPDILAAESQLHASSARIGVATAALFPSVELSGAYGRESTSTHNLFGANSKAWNAGTSITAPIFHGGTLWYERKAAIDSYEQSLASYQKTVLTAFAQVADVLRALEHDAEVVVADAEAMNASDEALQLIQYNYQAGLVDYLQVLIASLQDFQAKNAYIGALAQRYQDTVALYVAMGGGWEESSAAQDRAASAE
jgi:NodT family efflux transporter outer membrane factor (OMF) lipoprotein